MPVAAVATNALVFLPLLLNASEGLSLDRFTLPPATKSYAR